MLDRALALAARGSDALVRARAHLYEAVIRGDAGDLPRARSAVRRAKQEARGAGSLLLEIRTTWTDDTAPDAIERLEALLGEAEAGNMVFARLVALNGLASLYHDRGRHLEFARMTKKLEAALDTVRQVAGPELVSRFENGVGTGLVRAGKVEAGRALLLSSLKMTDSLGWRHDAVFPLGGLAEVQSAIGESRDVLILFSATEAMARELGLGALLGSFDREEQAAIKAAEEHLGAEVAAEAWAIGESMTYREAVDFAFEINGVTPP
jgi:hypothetical protein